MKKIILAAAVLLAVAPPPTTQTVNFSPAVTATSYTFFTNDHHYPTVLQRLDHNQCFADVEMPALHISATPASISSFTFRPGYSYTLTISGTATVSGGISQPPSTIPIALALWAPQANPNMYLALTRFPNAYTMIDYAGQKPFNIDCFGYTTAFDVYGTYLTSFIQTATVPNSASQPFSFTTAPFLATSTGNVLTIEVPPILGDVPSDNILLASGCGCSMLPVLQQTNTVLTINSITYVETANATPQINGAHGFYFDHSTLSGSGTITAPPGTIVSVTINANGQGGATFTTACNITGAVFSTTGGGSIVVTNSSTTSTITMPASGVVYWTGNFSETASVGGGGIVVN